MLQLLRLSVVALCLVGSHQVVWAQNDTAADEAKAWLSRRLAECAAFEAGRVMPAGERLMKLERTPLLNWTNPIRKTAAGAVFVWTDAGRPQLIASMYPYEAGIEYEFTSLSADEIVLRGNGHQERLAPGITWRDVATADPPHQQRALRLAQMRRIADAIEVRGNGKNRFDTRLLTQPIYRTPEGSNSDAAIFAFVQGTDPEAVLIIEPTDKPGWRYAFGRMSSVPLAADDDGQRVWEVPASWEATPDNRRSFCPVRFPGAK